MWEANEPVATWPWVCGAAILLMLRSLTARAADDLGLSAGASLLLLLLLLLLMKLHERHVLSADVILRQPHKVALYHGRPHLEGSDLLVDVGDGPLDFVVGLLHDGTDLAEGTTAAT